MACSEKDSVRVILQQRPGQIREEVVQLQKKAVQAEVSRCENLEGVLETSGVATGLKAQEEGGREWQERRSKR